VAEGGTRAATDSPVFTLVQPPRGGIYANVSASSWLEQDWSYGELGSWLLEEVGRAQGQEIGKQLMLGDGTNKPAGIATVTTAATSDGTRAFGTGEHVLSGVVNSLDLDSCVNAFFKLQPEYQERASWLMSPAAFAVLRSQKASTAGSYMMDVSISAGGPPTLLGRPVYLDVNVPAPAADALAVIVGDFGRGYSVVYYGSPVIIRDPYSVKGQLSFYAERRVGGKWMDTNAFKFIKCSST
jgi:HK97 family phage major capsid protein